MRNFSIVLCMVALLAALAPAPALAIGDNWTVVRGDNSPGVEYTAFVETPSGRWLAAGPGGQLMISDDAGTTWRYEVILDDDGRPLFGTVGDLLVRGNTVIGTVLDLVPSSAAPWEGRTRIISSNNNGDSWSVGAFPLRSAFLGGVSFPGVYLPKLHVAPSGQLIAYGSTVVSNGAIAYFIGGAIFAQVGGNWQQVFFGYGSIESMALANNRLVAAGLQSMLDSPDGVSWNGYPFANAQMLVGGNLLDAESRSTLFASDVAFINNNVVIHTIRFRRSQSDPRVLQAINTGVFTFESPNPFDGGRIWNGTQQNQSYSGWVRSGGNVISLFRGAYTSSTGQAWGLADASVRVRFGSAGPIGPQSLVAVGNSDEVWRSDNAGVSWSKILDTDPGPNLGNMVRVGNRLLSRVGNVTVWSSVDNGATWTELADVRDQTGRSGLGPMRVAGERIWAAQSGQIATSPDGGETWQAVPVPFDGSQDLWDVVVAGSGRLVLAPESKAIIGVTDPANFYTSDDNGQTWTARPVEFLGFNDSPKRGRYVGNGRIIYLYNSFASFDPKLIISDDNGVTWRMEDPFQILENLNRVFNEPDTRVLELERLFQSESGRLFILGDAGEVLTSDDRGDSWTVSLNNEYFRPDDEPFLNWDVSEIVESNGRIVVAGSRRSGPFPYTDLATAMVSEDDGNTWREVVIPTNQEIGLFNATVGLNGRIVFSGSRGAVYISDPDAPPADGKQSIAVREGEVLDVDIARPPVAGDLNMTYRMTAATATEDDDYLPMAGTLQWLSGDETPRTVSITTVDDAQAEATETLQLDLVSDGDVVLSFSYLIEITDNEGTGRAGVELIVAGSGTDPLWVTESGGSDELGVALTRAPTGDVTISFTSEDQGEVTVGTSSLTFTPQNWNQQQTVTLTGVDDAIRDRNTTTRVFLAAASSDEDYQDVLTPIAYVINQDDERDEVILADGFEG